MDARPLSGNAALVTGGSRGLGRVIALALARAGADVAVNHRTSAATSLRRAEETCREVSALGVQAIAVAADISCRTEVDGLVAAVRERFGRLDVLVLNAARAPFKPYERLLERDLRQLVDVNFLGNVLCVRAALPLLEANGGRVVFVSSQGSRASLPTYPLGAMKAAMEVVVRDWAPGLRARGVTLSAVCPGLLRTDSLKTLRQVWEGIDTLDDHAFADPEEVAAEVVELCLPPAP